ncbi:MAG: FAD-binding protein, partial [Chloroflexi bacterium]|nr:FAD-binding protein [Chloroflexota bacterium]
TVKPNPCLAPLKTPPFYGLRIYLSSSGTKSGLVIDEHARVKNVDGEAILGLYACPNAAAHVAVGKALTSGMTLSQSTTFGHLAALDMTR